MKPLNRKKHYVMLAFIMLAFIAVGTACGGKNVTPYTDPVCGNDKQEYGEDCDGSDLDGQTCAGLGLEGGDLACGADCRFDVTACTSEAVCDNGVIEYPEDCEGADLGGQTCQDLGFTGGTLACTIVCTFDTSGCEMTPECGDGVVAYPEDCDGNNLDGQTCESLGLGAGALACLGDCTFDVSGCPGTADCGNGEIEYPEDCEGADLGGQTCQGLGHDGGTLACAGDCTFDPSGCTDCGDGVAEGDEDCDGADLVGATCESQGHDGGTLACAGDCTFAVTGCIDCDPGLTYCDPDCVDLMTDHDHCNDCVTSCDFDQDCIGGVCTDHPWTPVGVGVSSGDGVAIAHAASNNGTDLFVAIVADPSSPVVLVKQWSGNSWTSIGGLTCATDTATSWVDLGFDGQRPHVVFPKNMEGFPHKNNIRLKYCESDLVTCSDEFYSTACDGNFALKMDLSGPDAHLTTIGAGGCGIGIGYAWYSAGDDSFYEHPGPWQAGLLPWEGNGRPDVVVTTTPYVAVMGMDWILNERVVYAVYWDAIATAWTPLDGDLKEGTGACGGVWGGCATTITADPAGTLYLAWTEECPQGTCIHAKRHDPSGWTLVGGPINDFGEGLNPVIHVSGSELLVAYEEVIGNVHQIFVKRWNGASWEGVGPVLNNDPTRDAVKPDITSISGTVYVSFMEDTDGNGAHDVFVKSFP